VDNFHTAYVLDSLDDFVKLAGGEDARPALDRGFRYYEENFFEGDVPKYFQDSLYPVDIHCVSQSIITMVRFGRVEKARRVAEWALANMWNEEGYFYYRKNRFWTNRNDYVRWSQAWMMLALALLLKSVPK
jgi:hypothetical protein